MELVLNDGGISRCFFSKIARVLKLGVMQGGGGGGGGGVMSNACFGAKAQPVTSTGVSIPIACCKCYNTLFLSLNDPPLLFKIIRRKSTFSFG